MPHRRQLGFEPLRARLDDRVQPAVGEGALAVELGLAGHPTQHGTQLDAVVVVAEQGLQVLDGLRVPPGGPTDRR